MHCFDFGTKDKILLCNKIQDRQFFENKKWPIENKATKLRKLSQIQKLSKIEGVYKNG